MKATKNRISQTFKTLSNDGWRTDTFIVCCDIVSLSSHEKLFYFDVENKIHVSFYM